MQMRCMEPKVSGPKSSLAVFRRSLLVFLGLVLGFNVYLANASSVGGNLMPMPFGCGFAVVQSGSMEPTLHVGDLLVVRQQGAYDVNDVVVFQSGRSLVVHRIVDKSATGFTTQGDANNTADEPIETEAVKGKVVGSVAFLGYVMEWLRSPVGILLVLVAGIALVELSFQRERKLAKMQQLLQKRQVEDEIRQLKSELGGR